MDKSRSIKRFVLESPVLVNAVAGIKNEIFRKSIHLMVAFTPLVASIHYEFALVLLSIGILGYSYSEFLRSAGYPIPFIAEITVKASRERDKGRFVLGPVTLGLGAMAALFFFPMKAAAIGIFALAFGDGLSSLFGKLFGRTKIPFMKGKTFVGSFVCFGAVFLSSYAVTRDFRSALILSMTATLIEVLPLKDFDNILIPVGTALAAMFFI